MSEIKVYKTITGEDLIADVVDVKDAYYVLKDPCLIVLQQTEGGVSVGLAPYMPYAKGNIALYANAVTAEALPDESMVTEYKRVFSPIVTQNPSIIVPK